MNDLQQELKRFKIIVSLVLILLAAALVVIGWLLLRPGSAGQRPLLGPSASVPDQASAIAADLQKEVTLLGSVVSVSDKALIVRAQLVDVSKLSSLDFSKPVRLPSIDKEVTIAVTASQVAGVKAGDGVTVVTNPSVYAGGTIKAVSVTKLPGT